MKKICISILLACLVVETAFGAFSSFGLRVRNIAALADPQFITKECHYVIVSSPDEFTVECTSCSRVPGAPLEGMSPFTCTNGEIIIIEPE